jgi:ubiquinone/menaquinone biosynthesis C-methylase UbiE
MAYDADSVVRSYGQNAEIEDASEKGPSLRVEIPREFIKKHLKPSDVVLDAGGGTGINAIIMAKGGARVTLLDLTPRILEIAERNIRQSGVSDKIDLVQGDITDLSRFRDEQFTFVVCVGDAISYVLDRRFDALDELIRVARAGSLLVIGCDSKLGFARMKLSEGSLDEAADILETSETFCGMGPKTHVYTVDEMTELLEERGCQILEVASTPTFADTIDLGPYKEDPAKWEKLKKLELGLCTRPELLGMGLHLLFVARKDGPHRGPVQAMRRSQLDDSS